MSRKKSSAIVPVERVRQVILLLRGQRVILDADLARLYGVATERLKQQVRRNIDRFPGGFHVSTHLGRGEFFQDAKCVLEPCAPHRNLVT